VQSPWGSNPVSLFKIYLISLTKKLSKISINLLDIKKSSRFNSSSSRTVGSRLSPASANSSSQQRGPPMAMGSRSLVQPVTTLLICLTSCSPAPMQTPHLQGLPAIVEAESVPYKVIRADAPSTFRVKVRNLSSTKVIISKVSTTCHCVQLGPLPISIAPEGHVAAKVTYDPRLDPDFYGGLSIGVIGTSSDGRDVLKADVLFDVRKPPHMRDVTMVPR